MIFVDTHCHLNLIENDLTDVINRAIDSGISKMIVPGIDLQSSNKALEIAEKYDAVYAAVGIHPHESSKASSQDINQISQLAMHPKVVAIGEIGLDYHYHPFRQSLCKKRFYLPCLRWQHDLINLSFFTAEMHYPTFLQ